MNAYLKIGLCFVILSAHVNHGGEVGRKHGNGTRSKCFQLHGTPLMALFQGHNQTTLSSAIDFQIVMRGNLTNKDQFS